MSTVRPQDPFSKADLENLASVDSDVCVSLYMPTHPSAPESHQDPVRLRNLLDEAQTHLLESDLERSQVDTLLKPARDLLPDELFWTHQSEGLALFLSQESFRKYRLPAPFEQTVEVARQFLVTPLVWLLKPGQEFYLLAVSQNSCRLFHGTQFQIEELKPAELPSDLQSALGWWRERRLSFHSQPRGQTDAAIYHGHEEDDKSIDLAAYLRKVAEPVRSLLHNQSAPLVFAGVKELFPIFQKVYDGKGLMGEAIHGNPDDWSSQQLHQAAWPIVERHNKQQTEQVWDAYHASENQQQGTQDLNAILSASRDGLVETLLIPEGARQLGTFDSKTNQHETSSESKHAVDLINLATVQALRTGAKVTVVSPSSFPRTSAAAAILRSPLSAIAKP